MGKIDTPGHTFDGRAIALSQRHTAWDGVVNIVIDPNAPPDQQVFGYAELSERPGTIAG